MAKWKRPTNPLTQPFNPRLATVLAKIAFYKQDLPCLPAQIVDGYVSFVMLSQKTSIPIDNWHDWIGLVSLFLVSSRCRTREQARDFCTALLADLMTGPVHIADLALAAEHQHVLEDMGYEFK